MRPSRYSNLPLKGSPLPNFSASEISGIRIWLSGSIPDSASPEQAIQLRDFARSLAKSAFAEGAQVLHGFHPTLAPTLLETARQYRASTNRKAPLSLFVSAHFRDAATGGYGGQTVTDMERDCGLRQVPQAPTRDRSLEELGNALASQADVLVAIGGRWWDTDRSQAGVPKESLLALARGIPAFLLGGFGGTTAGHLGTHPEILALC